MAFRLFVDSSNGLTVEPEWDYKEESQKIETRSRVRSGAEYVYKWAEFEKIKFSVSFVDSNFKSIVNSWWSNNTDLLFMEEGSSVVTSVHLSNGKTPVGKFIKPYNNLSKGIIELSTY
ncbi:hypothetical protein KAR91_47675 [Candidatus Pacearchaeota archaeon]|nr:hypothetical protein [Candidatus Pacearchaeota archaeon]